jgi:hypothetical protein
MLLAGAAPAIAQQTPSTPPVYLQWWENKWADMEHRTPDFYMAGYGALWLPPASKCGSTNSAGYDVYDRFDLGKPGAQTAFGTDAYFRAVVNELQQTAALVNLDIVMNHNGARDTSYSFWAAGGFPGLWGGPLPATSGKLASDNWGDFHNGTGCCTYYQSQDPSSANYNLLNGDLVGLIDIAQEANNVYIRQPIIAGNPQNIPAGTSVNLPNPINSMFYPDLSLTPVTFTNPGTTRNPGSLGFTVYPFNTVNQSNGTPVAENATGLLMRWTQMMLDVYHVDGFRIDAIKHSPSWFYDKYWDSMAYQRRTTPWGGKATPFCFGECVESNSFTYSNYVRKDAFANRDCLDLNGAGQLRNLISGNGLGSWNDVVTNHLDLADDGVNNGSIGVTHVFSHDNGSAGDGSSQPPLPTYKQMGYVEHAYILMRSGVPIVYHNARGISRPGGFWPREGVPLALGVDPYTNAADPTITTLVQLHNWYARGDMRILNGSGTALNDVVVFERAKNLGSSFSANVLVGVNDRYDGGFDGRTVTTSFPAGTLLREMTGNSDDPIVNSTNAIPKTIIVGTGGVVTITVPRNLNASNVQHNKGYVIYAPVVPVGTLSVTPVASTIAGDTTATNIAQRRTTPVPVITGPTFTIQLQTTANDIGDADTDDSAVFKIDKGYADYNGNGTIDHDQNNTVVPGYEDFLTTNSPLYTGGSGLYQQTISTSMLSEGYHYISVLAFKHRAGTSDPLFREFRQVIYVDRSPPAIALESIPSVFTSQQYQFVVDAQDRTTRNVYFLLDVPSGTDPVTQIGPFSQGSRQDRYQWRLTMDLIGTGTHTLTIVATEDSGNARVLNVPLNVVLPCYANCDGSTSQPVLTASDFTCFLSRFRAGDPWADCDQSGGNPALTASDFTCFLNLFRDGCH